MGGPVKLIDMFQSVLAVGGFKAVVAIRGLAYISKQLRGLTRRGITTNNVNPRHSSTQIRKIYLDELYIYERLLVHGKPLHENEFECVG